MKKKRALPQHEIIREWEERELAGSYRCLATDRQHLLEVRTYRVIKYAQLRRIDPTTQDVAEEIVELEKRDERTITQLP